MFVLSLFSHMSVVVALKTTCKEASATRSSTSPESFRPTNKTPSSLLRLRTFVNCFPTETAGDGRGQKGKNGKKMDAGCEIKTGVSVRHLSGRVRGSVNVAALTSRLFCAKQVLKNYKPRCWGKKSRHGCNNRMSSGEGRRSHSDLISARCCQLPAPPTTNTQ